jgi:two-component system KDP operon response regulator KdpE
MLNPQSSDSTNQPLDALTIGRLTVDVYARRVWRDGLLIRLSPHEFDLLLCLAHRAGSVVTYDELWRAVWHCCQHTGGTLDQIKSCVKRLRQAIEPEPERPRYILNAQKHGYMMPARVDEDEVGKLTPD